MDPRHVFSEIEGLGEGGEDGSALDNELLNPERMKKAPAHGYETGATLLFKQAKASDFIMGDIAIHLLNNCHEIILGKLEVNRQFFEHNHFLLTKAYTRALPVFIIFLRTSAFLTLR